MTTEKDEEKTENEISKDLGKGGYYRTATAKIARLWW